jgi:hypothetical protein
VIAWQPRVNALPVEGVATRQVTSDIVWLKRFKAHCAIDGRRTAEALKWIRRQLGHDFGGRCAQWLRKKRKPAPNRKRSKLFSHLPPPLFLMQLPPPMFLLCLPPQSNHEVVAATLAGKASDGADNSRPTRASCTRDNHVGRDITADQLLLLMQLYHFRNLTPLLAAGLGRIISKLCGCHFHRLLEHDDLPDDALPALGILFPSVSKLHFLRKEIEWIKPITHNTEY